MQVERVGGRTLIPHPKAKAFPEPPDWPLDPDTLAANFICGFEHGNERIHPFFVMRSQLLKHVSITGQRVLAVTSAQPGNGKTHVAVNLAAALSRIYPTVLMELDLRRPSISQRLGLPRPQPGVDDFLAGEADWSATARKIQGFNLSIHCARQPRVNAEDLLSSGRLAVAIEAIRARDDQAICIIDTPPALVDDDLTLIARAVDGALMVVEEARTRKRALLDAVNALSPCPIVGSILNMSISSPRPANDYKYYEGHKGAGRDEDREAR